MRRKGHLGFASQLPQPELRLDQRLDLAAPPFKGVNDNVFRHKQRVAFHHGQCVGAGGEDNVKIAVFLFLKRRVEDKLSIHAADAPARHGALKRQR